ncbi:MAG TPA: Dabb family protein [Noviherbaspirillum sp.]|jgi:hypothetical protein
MTNHKTLRHVVLFSYTPGTSPEQRQRIADDFASLPGKIPAVRAFEYGDNCSPENLNDGFEYCFMLSFHSEGERDAYLVHPEHAAFVERLKPWLAKALVVDYWARG